MDINKTSNFSIFQLKRFFRNSTLMDQISFFGFLFLLNDEIVNVLGKPSG
jgi:hypothetical protein